MLYQKLPRNKYDPKVVRPSHVHVGDHGLTVVDIPLPCHVALPRPLPEGCGQDLAPFPEQL